LGKIAHEFKTPLNSIIGLITQIKQKKATKQESMQQLSDLNISNLDCDILNADLNLIQYLSNYTIYLINDVIQFVSNEKISDIKILKTKINLKKILSFCYEILKTLISLNESKQLYIKPIFVYDNILDNYDIFSDEVRLNQIFLNLISNSVKFTKSGHIKLSALYSRFTNEIIISVEDTGFGIKPDELNIILNENETKKININYKTNQMGTGIGLSLSNNIAKRLNHKLEFNSEYQIGTIVQLKFASKSFLRNSYYKKLTVLKEKENTIKTNDINNNNLSYKNNHIQRSMTYKSKNKINNYNITTLTLKRTQSNDSKEIKSLFDNENNYLRIKDNITNEKKINMNFPRLEISEKNSPFINIIDNEDDNFQNDYQIENEFSDIDENKHKIHYNLNTEDNSDYNSVSNLFNNNEINQNEIAYNINENYSSNIKQTDIDRNDIYYTSDDNITNMNNDFNFIFDYQTINNKLNNNLLCKSNLDNKSNSNFNISENLSNSSIAENSSRNLINFISKNVFVNDKFIENNPLEKKFSNKKVNEINFEIKPTLLDINFKSKLNGYNYELNKGYNKLNPTDKNHENNLKIENKVENSEYRSIGNLINRKGNLSINLSGKSENLITLKKKSSKNNFIRILVVDDIKFLRQSLKNTISSYFKKLKRDDIEIIEANDGIDMMKIIIEDQVMNSIKYIFTDENMETVNGSQAVNFLRMLEKSKKIKKNIYVLVSSMDDNNESTANFKKLGFDFIFTKPLHISKLDIIFDNN